MMRVTNPASPGQAPPRSSVAFARCEWLAKYEGKRPWLRGAGYQVVRRGVDLLAVVLTAPLTIPLALFCAVAIKLESPRGPAIFVQHRSGLAGRRFALYKFRTMVPEAEELKAELADRNELSWPDFKIEHDPRITKVGRLLRSTSLDELPQLLNVLRGDMGLVGPRPTFFPADDYTLWQTERLDARPGLTGVWQLGGRASVDFADRSRLDIAYVRLRRLTLDLEIVLRTIPRLLKLKDGR